MKSKSKRPNAFAIFTHEWRRQTEQRSQLPITEAFAQAGIVWDMMTNEERQLYKNKAKKPEPDGRVKELRNCNGFEINIIKIENEIVIEQEQKNKVRLKNMLSHAMRNNNLETRTFCFIMFNYFVKIPESNMHIPAEVALCEYSLRAGNKRIWTQLISPVLNDLFYGRQYEALEHSITTHKLPLPPNALGEKNYELVYDNIVEFIRQSDSFDGDFMLYTYEEHIPIVRSCLKFLKYQKKTDSMLPYGHLSISSLFFELMCASCEATKSRKPKSKYLTDLYFERDKYEYQSGISCEYHEKVDCSRYCSKAVLTRWGYIFSEHICPIMGIPLQIPSHSPNKCSRRLLKSKDCEHVTGSVGLSPTRKDSSTAGLLAT